MVRGVHVTYVLVLPGLLVAGFLIEASWWATALVGIGAMVPVVIADVVSSRRRRPARGASA